MAAGSTPSRCSWFAADGLAVARRPAVGAVGDLPARRMATARGFNVVLWRAGDLGYALVSDVSTRELLALGHSAGPDGRPTHRRGRTWLAVKRGAGRGSPRAYR